jgi:hypothetical protein
LCGGLAIHVCGGATLVEAAVEAATPRAQEPVVTMGQLDEAFLASIVEDERFVAALWIRVTERPWFGAGLGW